MSLRYFVFLITLFFFFGCGKDKSNPDIDNYESVTIGDQVWMTRNLDVSHYRNGDEIPHVTDKAKWENLKTGAWCYYDNDSANGKIYGKLYNWYAVIDPRGLAPDGWHVPSDNEWTDLENFLGGPGLAGGKLKSEGTINAGDGLWYSPNLGATNESGFSALPGGYRSYNDGLFRHLGSSGAWWASTEFDASNAWLEGLGCGYTDIGKGFGRKEMGFSVRCVKD